MDNNKVKTLPVRMSVREYDELKKTAKEIGLSASAAIRLAVETLSETVEDMERSR